MMNVPLKSVKSDATVRGLYIIKHIFEGDINVYQRVFGCLVEVTLPPVAEGVDGVVR